MSQNETSRIIPVDITNEMKDNYISYAMSTIVDRALPDVRDGFKPIHRRILFAMSDMGCTYNKPYKKAARIVGEVMGKYHPHGDTSIYGALVRMAQEWSLNHALVDGQGNFGSQDGDPCAAMRYTEARLSKIADCFFSEIKKDAIDWQYNFDDSLEEPSILPVMFPQLAVNGTSGIAVGMATSILPHNLREVIDATIAIINDPNITDEDLLHLLPGPDFPTGGVIYGVENVRRGMLTGRGSTTLRGGYDIEEGKNGKLKIVITSIPYTVNRDTFVEQVGDMIKEGTLEGISDINNESNKKEGTRIVVELKKDATPLVVINHLYKHTNLQITQTINNTVLVDGRPREMSTFGLLREWIKFRYEVVKKRLQFDINELNKRIELLKGYIIILNDLDKAVSIIRSSDTPTTAKTSLKKEFRLNENQAKHILDLRLAKLTGLEIKGINDEHDELLIKVKSLNKILNSDELIYQDIKDSLQEISNNFGRERLTIIDYAGENANMDDFVENKDIIISVSNIGYVKRTDIRSYRVQGRGGKGILVANSKDDDFIKNVIYANTHSYLLIFTDKGRCYHIKAYLIPEGERNTKGRPIKNFVDLQDDEKIVSFATTDTFEGKVAFICTKTGVIKKIDTTLLVNKNSKKSGVTVVKIDGEDTLLGAVISDDTNTVMVANQDGDVVRFPDKIIRTMGRNAMGLYAMKTTSNLVSLLSCDDDNLYTITISEKGFGKKTSLDQYRITGRYNKGISTMKCTKKTGKLVKLLLARKTDDVMITCKSGKSIRINVTDIKTISRDTQGVILVDIAENDSISDAVVIYNDTDGE